MITSRVSVRHQPRSFARARVPSSSRKRKIRVQTRMRRETWTRLSALPGTSVWRRPRRKDA